eukprot:TRINITY_DN6744_c0_g1_i5.p4 TRINITY_DN6744_c0_g1~~TRINITY_DN6744_c0_g1_i5.p4  ORF type:complete len:123 (+),score=17.89 TRINITY_DN6744_c0_g1_i5:667-1035(+)
MPSARPPANVLKSSHIPAPNGMSVEHIPEFLRHFPLEISFAGEVGSFLSGQKMQEKQQTEKERVMTKLKEKASIENSLEKNLYSFQLIYLADEVKIKSEVPHPAKTETKVNPFLANVSLHKE